MRVYLDHHAATPLCGAAREAMAEALPTLAAWGNPASPHATGRAARARMEAARAEVAGAIGAAPADVVLTSGGTEACNLGVRGLLAAAPAHLVTTGLEHPAVARPLEALEAAGAAVTRLAPDADAEALGAALRPDTALVALQWVNHEVGQVWPVEAYAEACRARGVPLLVDATQALGKLPVDVATLDADAVAFAAHKAGGPAGAGALWVRRGVTLAPLLAGGGQERGRRPGSPDLLAAVGFGAACAVVQARLAEQARIGALRDRLEAALVKGGAAVNLPPGPRVGTVTSLAFQGRDAAVLVAALDVEGVEVSAGAACSSGVPGPSAVLASLYAGEAWRAKSSIRLSFGPESTEDDVDFAIERCLAVLARTKLDGA